MACKAKELKLKIPPNLPEGWFFKVRIHNPYQESYYYAVGLYRSRKFWFAKELEDHNSVVHVDSDQPYVKRQLESAMTVLLVTALAKKKREEQKRNRRYYYLGRHP